MPASWRRDESSAAPEELIAWALSAYPGLLITSGFNLNGVVLIDMAVREGYRGVIAFVDTGSHFRETLETRDRLAERYRELNFLTLTAEGTSLPPCGSTGCCRARKVEPLRRYLRELAPSALLTARSRFQSPSRARLGLLEAGADLVRINPLAYRSRQELEHYAGDRDLPVNPLYWRGYLSIGCAPTTRAVGSGEQLRSGRWNGEDRLECGLWQGEGMI